MRFRTLALCLAVTGPSSLLLASFASTPALAQSDADRATARQLGQDGEDALDKKDWPRAEDRFRRADQLVHAPTLVLGLARALAGEGKYVESQETYNRMIREGLPPSAPDVFKKAIEDAKKEVDGVGAKIGGVTITVTASGGGDAPGMQVMLDDKPVNVASLGIKRAVDPGNHSLKVTATGFKAAALSFKVPEGGSVNEPITLERAGEVAPIPPASASATTTASAPPTAAPTDTASTAGGGETPPPKSGGSVLPWVAFGVGGVGLAVGTITGILAIGKHSTLAGECSGTCPSSAQSDLDSYHLMGTLSTVGFIVGGVGVAAGVVLLFVHPGRAEATPAATAPAAKIDIQPVVGFGTIGAVGHF
jgi:hypothetical protein